MAKVRNKNKQTVASPKKVFVALSGGVDSAAAAILLKESGYEVSGAFMDLWPTSREKKEQARKVALAIGIPFYVFNLRQEFRKRIVDPFLKSYQSGLTPNPCVDCNAKIKFDLFWRKAKEKGADLMATGHYARIKDKDGVFQLQKGVDLDKDQSYFLWRLKQKDLKRTLFPLGGYFKKDIRKIVKDFGLPVGESKESMDVCFIEEGINCFLKQNLSFSPGPILDDTGREIGRHQGLPLYTIGQRKGIDLPGGPYYVCDKDFKKNFLMVSKNEECLYRSSMKIKNVSWIDASPPFQQLIEVKIRYRQKPTKGFINKTGRYHCFNFENKQKAVTPGQSAVFYQGKKLLGGGVILD